VTEVVRYDPREGCPEPACSDFRRFGVCEHAPLSALKPELRERAERIAAERERHRTGAAPTSPNDGRSDR